MQPFILVRFVQLSAQLAALYLLIMIGDLCTKLPFDQFIKEASFECISSLRSAGINVKGWNMEPESDQYYGLNSEAQLVVEQLREAVEPDVSSNFTAASKLRNQSGDPVIGLLLSSQNSTSSDANMTAVSNAHANSNKSDFLSLNDSLNIFVREEDNVTLAETSFLKGSFSANENTASSLHSFQVESVVCLNLSYKEILMMDLGVVNSHMNAPIAIVTEIIFTFLTTAFILYFGPLEYEYADVIEKAIHFGLCALSAVFIGDMKSNIRSRWRMAGFEVIIPTQWNLSMFTLLVLTLIFIAEVFYWNFLFMDVRLTIGFGEYDLVKAAAEEIAQSEAAKENDDHADDNRSLMDTDHSSSIEGSESEMK